MSHLEIRIHPEVLEVDLDPEGGGGPGAVGVVELRHPGDVELDHVLLHLLGDVVAVPRPVPGHSQLRLRALIQNIVARVKTRNTCLEPRVLKNQTRLSSELLLVTLFMMME